MADKYFSMPLDYQMLEADEAVKLMNPAQFGCYIRLLISCWHEGSLPPDIKKIESLSTYKGRDFVRDIWKCMKVKFPRGADGRLHNKVVDEKRQGIKTKQEKQSEGGREGAKKRWLGNGLPNGLPIEKDKGGDSNQNHNYNKNNQSDQTDFLNFKDEQITELRRVIALKLNHTLLSEANQQIYRDFKKRIERYVKKHHVKNPFEYALKSANNIDKDFKNANPT